MTIEENTALFPSLLLLYIFLNEGKQIPSWQREQNNIQTKNNVALKIFNTRNDAGNLGELKRKTSKLIN